MENGVEIIGTIITDVDRNAEKIVLPKYVEGTLWNMSLCNIKCIEVEDVNVLRLFTGLPEKLIVKNTDRFMVDENFFIRPGMKYIEICEENEFYKTIDGIVYTKDGKTLLKCPRNHPGKVVVPDGVEVIAESAFEDTSITDIVLPDSLRKIERRAFFDCSKLKSVDFGHGLESLGDIPKPLNHVFHCAN